MPASQNSFPSSCSCTVTLVSGSRKTTSLTPLAFNLDLGGFLTVFDVLYFLKHSNSFYLYSGLKVLRNWLPLMLPGQFYYPFTLAAIFLLGFIDLQNSSSVTTTLLPQSSKLLPFRSSISTPNPTLANLERSQLFIPTLLNQNIKRGNEMQLGSRAEWNSIPCSGTREHISTSIEFTVSISTSIGFRVQSVVSNSVRMRQAIQQSRGHLNSELKSFWYLYFLHSSNSYWERTIRI